MWTENSNPSDYSTEYDSYVRNISLEKTIGSMLLGLWLQLLFIFLPIPGLAQAVASSIISGVTSGYGAYASAKQLYCYETVYKNNYLGISYAKMINQKYYYDSDLEDMVPNSEKNIFGSWG